jgi:hypothetical protein
VLLNFIFPKSIRGDHEFTIFGENIRLSTKPSKKEPKLISARHGTISTTDLKILLEEHQTKRVIVYVKSEADVSSLLPMAEKESKAKKEPKEEGKKLKKKKAPATLDGHVIGWRGGATSYKLVARLRFPEDDPVLTAVIVASFSISGKYAPFFLDLEIEADDPDELISALQEGMSGLMKKKSTERSTLIRALEGIYSDAHTCVKLLTKKMEWPTLERLSADKTLVSRIKKYDIFEEIQLVTYDLYVPPITPEEYYHLQTRLEVSILPYSLDWNCRITSCGEKDALYNKLLASLPEGAFESGDSLTFPYGALIDCGQAFTYAECYEISTRVTIA